MAAAKASARGQRAAILASPLHELTGFCLAVDCLAAGCRGERAYAVTELASFYGRDIGLLAKYYAVCGYPVRAAGVEGPRGSLRPGAQHAGQTAASGAAGARSDGVKLASGPRQSTDLTLSESTMQPHRFVSRNRNERSAR